MNRLSALISVLALLGTCHSGRADIIFESGTLGPTGLTFPDFGGGPAPGGSGVNPNVFSGVRFELAQPVITTRIGGHFADDTRNDDSFFGAIVRLDDASDFPNSPDLSSSDVMGTTSLMFPNPSAEVFGNLSIELEAGSYALVFGSGLFGANGGGAAVLNNPDIGSPSYIAFQTGDGWLDLATLPGPFENFRMVVEGNVVPEPCTLGLLGMVSLLSVLARGKRV